MNCEDKRIEIPLGNEKYIVAELCNYDGKHPEIAICIQDNGVAVQDICIIRPHEEVGVENKSANNECIDCLVWSDENDEDYSHKFVVPVFIENDEIASEYVKDRLVSGVRCNRCGMPVLVSEDDDYVYQCMLCDEDLMGFEAHIGPKCTREEFNVICSVVRDSTVIEQKKNR